MKDPEGSLIRNLWSTLSWNKQSDGVRGLLNDSALTNELRDCSRWYSKYRNNLNWYVCCTNLASFTVKDTNRGGSKYSDSPSNYFLSLTISMVVTLMISSKTLLVVWYKYQKKNDHVKPKSQLNLTRRPKQPKKNQPPLSVSCSFTGFKNSNFRRELFYLWHIWLSKSWQTSWHPWAVVRKVNSQHC